MCYKLHDHLAEKLIWFGGVCLRVCVLCFCSVLSVHEASEYSLDYVQVHNRLLLNSSSLTVMHVFTNSYSNEYKLVKRAGRSHEGVGRKKRMPAWKRLALDMEAGWAG